ncbi:ABC transporter substrate-binding protein [Desulfurococcaceae archaeon MEX13E-LK6-19]|nr:ABC transporter substrate-binding protein [Desulfurococcaceae archaeon MEX13E-LK6-19]
MDAKYIVFLLIGAIIGAGLSYVVSSHLLLTPSGSSNLTGNATNVTVVFAVELNDHSAAFWIAYDKGWFSDAGINVEVRTFSTGLDLAIEMSRGDIDVALVCVGPAIVIKSKGVDLRLVAMTHLHGYALVARPEYNSIEELNGKLVSVSGPGSPVWLLAHLVEEKYNVTFEYRKMPPFMAVNALMSGKIDAAFIPEHYATLVEAMGAHVLLRSQDVWPSMPGSGVVVMKKFLDKHPDIVAKIVEIIGKATDYIREHPDEAAKIVAKHLATDYGIMKKSMEHLDYTIEINTTAIKEYIDLLVRFGAIDKPISVEEFIDTKFIGET